jgi:hypothetical protein
VSEYQQYQDATADEQGEFEEEEGEDEAWVPQAKQVRESWDERGGGWGLNLWKYLGSWRKENGLRFVLGLWCSSLLPVTFFLFL